MSKLLLIDGNSLFFRAYYGTAYSSGGILTNSKGIPVNAVLTFFKMIRSAIEEINPSHVLVAFDAGSKTVRHKKLDSYKAGRKKTPIELIKQFPIVKKMLNYMGIKNFELDLIEADDIIATLANKYKDKNEVVVLSSDKDLFQLVSHNVSISVPQNGSKPNKNIVFNDFYDQFGYYPNQVCDFKGLVGDSSDNLPGVKGLGPKTATKLLNEYDTLEGIYKNIENISGSTKEKLISDKENAFLCKELAELIFEVEIPYSFKDLSFKWSISNELISFFKEYELHSLIKKYSNSDKIIDENKGEYIEKTDEGSVFNKIVF